jgi:hypothetical protein
MNTLAGTVRGPNGAGLPGVEVTVEDVMAVSVTTVTDADGNFIAFDPPSGAVEVHFDGTTSTAPGMFPELGIPMTIATGENNLPQAIVLPDLLQGVTASVAVDGSGMTTSDTDVMFDTETNLSIPTGVTILLDGAPAVGSVDVNLTPVPAENVPMPLPSGLDPSSFVTIQPANATFDNGMNGSGQPQGVPIMLPNSRNLAVGTMLDMYSFDHAQGMWVNRSAETGNQGMVMDLGGGMSAIVANNVITEGGWHAGTVPVSVPCATTVTGRVVDLGGNPVPNVLVSLSTGQFGRTDSNGVFSIQLVTAYDAGMLPFCEAIDVEANFLAPVSFGAGTAQVTIMAAAIVHAGTTNIGDIPLDVTETGSLVGLVSDNGVGVMGLVSITGPQNVDVQTDAQGTFFVASLDPGDYMAAFDFGASMASVPFTVTAHETTVINIVPTGGGGGPQVNVLVIGMGELSAPAVPISGARVTLQASNTRAFGITNSNGIATFTNATGPYTVTAQVEMDIGGGNLQRLAMSLVGVNPPGSPVTIGVPLFETIPPIPTLDGTLQGTVSNVPVGTVAMVEISTNSVPGGFSTFAIPDQQGDYSVPVPSGVPLDTAAVAFGTSLGAVIETGLMVGSGQMLTQDYDFSGTSFCPFDNDVAVTYTNAPSGPDVLGFAFLQLSGAGDLFLPALLNPSMGDAPPMILLPDLSSAKLAGLSKTVEIGAEIVDQVTFDTQGSNCEMQLGNTTPTSIAVTFAGAPSIVTPADMATIVCSQRDCLDLEGEPLQFTLGAAVPALPNGVNVLDIDGDGPGGLTTQWDIWLPSNVTSTTLPRISPDMLMFFTGEYDLDVEVTRFNSPGFNFVTFFDANVAQRLRTVAETSDFCDSEGSSTFFVDAPAPPGPMGGGRATDKASRYREFEAALAAARERAQAPRSGGPN